MGFVLSILYFVTYYLTPETVFGPLGQYRIELILAILIILVSLPSLGKSILLKTPQSLALLGLAFGVIMSMLVTQHWAGGALKTFLLFIPNAFGYFLICLHFKTKKRLQVLVLTLLFVCLFVIEHGALDMYRGGPGFGPVQARGNLFLDNWNEDHWSAEHPYTIFEGDAAGLSWIIRLKGLGEISDPNDFGQLTVSVIPLMFIFWRPKKTVLNIAFVILPVCVLIYGVYLTHSRGALLALIAMAVVFVQRRIGKIPSLLLAGALFAGAMALNFTGGRGISASSGLDRTALWGAGLQLLKSYPVFGVGLGKMPEYAGLTAHNSLVVCAAELGLVGLFFWCLYLFPTVRDALAVASPVNLSEGQQIIPEEGNYLQVARKVEVIDKAEVNRLGRLIVMSLTGFLVAGWFLSRSYVLTLFMLGGIVEVIYQMAIDRGMIAPRWALGRIMKYALGLEVCLVILIYILIRFLNLAR